MNVPVTHPHTEDKHPQAWVVLWWGTTREGQLVSADSNTFAAAIRSRRVNRSLEEEP